MRFMVRGAAIGALLALAVLYAPSSVPCEVRQVAAQPPAEKKAKSAPLVLPARIVGQPGTFITVRAETSAKEVKYHSPTPGLSVFPADLLTDKTATVLVASRDGEYKLFAVACVDGKLTDFAETLIVIGKGPQPPPVGPVDPPTSPTPARGLYFLVVRADGPAPPGFADYMANAGWRELMDKGHLVKDKTASEAAKLGIEIPAGTKLPAVVTLRVSPGGDSSEVVRGPIPLPKAEDIVKLPEGVK